MRRQSGWIVGVVHTIRATCLLQFRELVTELGADPAAVLTSAGLRPDDAGRADRFISLRAAVAAAEEAAAATATPDFGRRLAARRGIETIDVLGQAARTAPTLEAALTIFSTYIATHSPGLHVQLNRTHGDGPFFEFGLNLDPPPLQCQAVEIGLGAVLQILRAILGPAYTPSAVHLPHSALTPPAEYIRYFGCTTRFAQPTAGFVFRTADLARSLRRADRPDHVAPLSALTAGSGPSLSRTVADIARTLLPTGALTIGAAADHLGLHPRTLQRRLAVEDTTFADVVDKVRRDCARRYLRDTDVSLDELTRLLGYSEQSVLTRSCRRWFATTPTTYRSGSGTYV